MIKSLEEARQKAADDAAASAYQYLEREAPGTLESISYMVNVARMNIEDIEDEISALYGPTEEKKTYKILLVAKALINERER